LGDAFQIPDTNISGKILDFSPALRIDQTGHPFTYANQMNNPAVLIEFSEAGKSAFSGWLLKRHPETWQLPDGSRVEFIDYWGVQFTGLQVRKDPGVWVVYLGCITMSIGLFIAFFMSHKKIWIKAVEEKNNTRVIIGATANKNRPAFERQIDKIISMLKKRQEGGK
jgi:cytochrome c biogenesis protein